VTLWSRIQGPGPVAVIAEAGVNHDGSVDDAHALVDLAASVGADAVKFQTFRVESLVSPGAESARYQQATTGLSRQGPMLQPLVLPDAAWSELSEHALSRPRERRVTCRPWHGDRQGAERGTHQSWLSPRYLRDV
jgi:sialic acid synthase SpsE